MNNESGYIQSTGLVKKETVMDYKHCTFKYSVQTHLRESDQGKITVAFDEAGIRPIDISFGVGYTSHIFLIYKIEGSDDLNIQANAYRFKEKHVDPCIVKVIDSIYGFGMFGRKKINVFFEKIY